MINFAGAHFDTFITVAVTVLGFIITYKMTAKSFGNEIRKTKISHNVEIIHSLPFDLCKLMSKIQKSKGKKLNANEYEGLITKIFAYGSKDAVNIATEIQQTLYRAAATNEDCGRKLLILFSILITQLKYDISDESITPESWFKLYINDYENERKALAKEINQLISEFSLNEKFYIDI